MRRTVRRRNRRSATRVLALRLEPLEARHLLTTWPFTTLPVSLVETNAPLAGELADLDGDRDLDVLSVSREDGEVAWYENLDGAGTYGRKISIFTSDSWFVDPRFVRATDFDADGDQDVLFVAQSAREDGEVHRLLWMENDGSGRFVTLHGSAEIGAEHFEIVDLDVDGDPDVLGFGGLWLENNGQGGLAQRKLPVGEHEIRVSRAIDMDDDGDPEILSAVRLNGESRLLWMENAGGTFTLESSTAVDDLMADVGGFDVDADGDLDPVYMTHTRSSAAIWWAENQGSPELGLRTQLSESGGQGRMDITDIDGDGLDDIVIASSLRDRVRDQVVWHKSQAGGGFDPAAVISDRVILPRDMVVGDIDGDSDADLLVTGFGSGQLAWLENRDAGARWMRHSATDAGPGETVALQEVDINADRLSDLVSAASDRGELYLHRNLGGDASILFAKPELISQDAGQVVAVLTADVDGDGDPDVISASADQGRIVWYENGEGWQEHQVDESLFGVQSMAVDDLDGDGDFDLVVAPSSHYPFVWFQNDGDGSFARMQIELFSVERSRVTTTDWDADGDTDLVLAYRADLENDRFRLYVSLLENQGDDGFVLRDDLELMRSLNHTYTPSFVVVADLMKSGSQDVLLGVDRTIDGRGRLFGLPSSFPNLVQTEQSEGVRFNPTSSEIFDLELDGDLDVAVGSQISAVFLATNSGGDAVSVLHVIPTVYSRQVAAADFDGDGDIDLSSGGFNSHQSGIVLHRNDVDLEAVFGDLDGDRNLDGGDFAMFCEGSTINGVVGSDPKKAQLDFDNSNFINSEDFHHFRENVFRVKRGDVNFDGLFDSTDLVEVFRAGHYEDSELRNSTWVEGDWNCDKEFNSSDFVAALAEGDYDLGPGPPTELSAVAARMTSVPFASQPFTRPSQDGDIFTEAAVDRPKSIELADAVDTLFAATHHADGDLEAVSGHELLEPLSRHGKL